MTKNDVLDYLKSKYDYMHKKFEIEHIGIFGSYAKDSASGSSDIDIFVKMNPKLSNMISLKEYLENGLQKKIDIIRLRDKMNPFLKKRIDKEGIYAV